MTVRHEGNRTIIHRDPVEPTSDAEKLRERDRYIATMRLSLEAKDARIAELEAILAAIHHVLGEDAASDDDTLAEAVAVNLRERDELIAHQESRLAEWQRDTARLDWMICVLDEWGSDGLFNRLWDQRSSWKRTAIDTAMQEKP